MLFFYIILLLVGEAQFSHPLDNLEIIGGREAFPHSLGYQVGIHVEKVDGPIAFCGGSLITPSYVLTAAHCLENVYSLEVVLGAHNISKEERTQIRVRTNNFTVHPLWNPKRFINDIAVIKLTHPVKTFWSIRTVRLPKHDKEDYAGKTGLLSGWGMIEYSNTGRISDVLEYARSTILRNEECKKTPVFRNVIQDTHLCLSGANRTSSCEGDSGGPLVVQGVQVGIDSFTVKQCKLTRPSVFTRVSKYLDWIRNNTDYN